MLNVVKRNRFYIPPILNMTQLVSSTDLTIDATTEKAALVFQIPKSGTITHLGIRYGAITAVDPTAIGLYTIDASGDPTTTAYGGMVAGALDPAATDDNTFDEAALATACTAVAGDVVALVVSVPTWTDANFLLKANTAANVNGLPYTDAYVGAPAWAKTQNHMIAYLKYSDGHYESIGVSSCIVANEAPASNTVPDEVGICIVSPVKFRADGFWVALDADAACQVVLYNGTPTALQTLTMTDPADVRGAGGVGIYHQLFASSVIIHAGSPYYLTVKPTTTTAVNLSVAEYPSAAAMADLADFGDRIFKVSRTDAGTFAHDFTKRPCMGFICG